MSNNSVIEGVKGMVVVSRCKRKSIPVIDAPLNEGDTVIGVFSFPTAT